MRHGFAGVIGLALLAAACGPHNEEKAPNGEVRAEGPSPAGSTPATVPAAAPPAASPVDLPGAPAFAALYPGSSLSQQPTLASDAAGSGGMVEFSAPATPEAVVDFYRERAEAAGLHSVVTTNVGDTRAYAAAEHADDLTSGRTLNITASPAGEGASVLLTWTGG